MPATGPTSAARRLGLDPRRVRHVQSTANSHWLVTTPDGDLVLRRYAPGMSIESIRYEHAVLRHLASRGWPVATPMLGPVDLEGAWWCAFFRLTGTRDRWPAGDKRHAARGELLARLHKDTAELATKLGQRDGWHRSDEAAELTPARVTTLARLRRHDRARAQAFEHHARTIGEGLAFLDAHSFARTIVHGDFLPWNLRWRDGELSAVFDLDATRIDRRATDVAFAMWGGRYPAVLDGYSAVTPLADNEEAALPLLWRAAWLSFGWFVIDRSKDRTDPQLDDVLAKLARPWEG